MKRNQIAVFNLNAIVDKMDTLEKTMVRNKRKMNFRTIMFGIGGYVLASVVGNCLKKADKNEDDISSLEKEIEFMHVEMEQLRKEIEEKR